MSITKEEHIRRRWGEYPALYRLITGKKIDPCLLSPKEFAHTSADYTWADWESNTIDVICQVVKHMDLIGEENSPKNNKDLLDDLHRLEKATRRLEGHWKEKGKCKFICVTGCSET